MKIYISLIIVFIILQFSLYSRESSSKSRVFVSPSKKLNRITFGYNDFVSSLLWVRVVQDFHICDQNSNKSLYPDPTEGTNPVDEILTRELPKSTCEKGWVYQMLDSISDLSPQFQAVYNDGATMLSVLVDDRLGAQKIFDKGRIYFPESWEIYYRSAYHELFDMQNANKSAELLRQAGKKGAPRWVFALAAKLYDRMGQAEFGKTILEDLLRKNPKGPHSDRLRLQLNQMNKVLNKDF